MTRPGGPAVPPGPSVGERIVQEWMNPDSSGGTKDLARRIDAALAAVARPVCNICAGSAILLDGETPCLCRDGTLAGECEGLRSEARKAYDERDAAARCLARARQEGAEAMRELAAQEAHRLRDAPSHHVAAAIRALK